MFCKHNPYEILLIAAFPTHWCRIEYQVVINNRQITEIFFDFNHLQVSLNIWLEIDSEQKAHFFNRYIRNCNYGMETGF